MPSCGAGLTVQSGNGERYHCYNYEHRVNRDKDACDLRPIRRKALDAVDALLDRILQPDHLRAFLAGLLD